MSSDANETSGPVLSRDWQRWLYAWTLAGSAGVCLALLLWSPLTILGIAAGPSVVAGLLFGAHALHEDHPRPSPARRPGGSPGEGVVLSTARVVLGTATIVVATAAVAEVSVPLALLLVAAVGLTAPPLVRRIAGDRSTTPTRPTLPPGPEARGALPAVEHATPETAIGSVRGLADDQLCLAWRRSYVTLQNAVSVVDKIVVVQLRQRCLDELLARNGPAVEAWLASGARAASGPDRYLARSRESAPGPEA